MNAIKEFKEELERLHSGYMASISSLVAQLEEYQGSTDKVKKVTKGQQSYVLKLSGKTWEKIGLDLSCAPTNACRLAKLHAKSNSLPWPIKQEVGD